MNLETLSSPGGDTGSACSLSSLLALGCRSRAEAAHSFAKKLHTKLWSLSPSQSTTDGLSTNPEENEEDASSWGVAVEARFDLNSKRVETVVTSVPLITSAFSNSNSNSIVYQPTGYQAFQVSQDPSPSEPAVTGSMEHKNANNCGSLEDGWSNYQKVHGGEQISSSGVRAHDQESDTSSTTTTNPMSDSDQYFDFGIETPVELDSAGEETVSHEVPIVINRDDGLPVQPEGMESGCIFGSPTLSGEDSDDIDDREEEPSFYESLSQSPASAGFAQKANHDRFNLNHSCEPVSGPPDAVNVNVDLSGHNGDAQAPSDSNAILDESAPAQSPAPRAEFSRVALGCSQGDLEDEGDGFTGDESATGPLRAEITHFTSTVSHGSHASNPTAEIQPKKDYSLETEDVNQVSDVLTHLSTLSLDMVRLDPIIVVDQLFNGSANVSDSRATTLQLELEKDSSEQYIVRENVVEITNDQSEIEASPEPEVDEEFSRTSTSSEATSTKESTPSKEEDGVTDDDEEEEDNQPNRHRVQRSTSLKSGKTPPGTPGRKKIVRFADALGLDLALVRTFLDEVPNVPQSAFNDLGDCTVEEDAALSRTAPQAGSSYIRITRRDPSTNSSVTTFVNSPRILVASFTQPGSLSDFLERVKKQKVCLETACMMDESKLRGVVRCLNIDFHKSVLIRYTTDEWRTQSDQQATYVPDSCDGLSDRFTFTLAGAQTMQPGQRLIFAICYRVAGQEIWDSNQSKNYVFQCISNSNYLPSIALNSPSVSDTFLPYM